MTDLDYDGPAVQWTTLRGSHGEFSAPGNRARVAYVLTYASLGDEGTGNTRITRDLLPVRELFDVGDMDFNELVQRDLDDFRVATEIIPYILRNTPYVRFFPPILAVLVPAAGKKILPFYPHKETSETPHPKDETQKVVREAWGNTFAVERIRKGAGLSDNATLQFNPDKSRLVVIDGQHRAMAMLAVRRSQSGEWGDRGRDFKHFYEDLANELRDQAALNALREIKLPVCICYFPELEDGSAAGFNAVQACRKLFLDVNHQAKAPTKARIYLLDDSDLRSVLARRILAEIRERGRSRGPSTYGLDLDCFEYDSPVSTPEPRRELAFSTIEMLREIVHWTMFSPGEYHTALKKRPSSGKASPRRERFLSEIRADDELTTPEIRSWGYDDLDNDLDPRQSSVASHQRLGDLFMKGWGRVITKMFDTLHPFVAHTKAVVDLRNGKNNAEAKLAYRALFDGQGVYWTIENYAEQRKRQRARGETLPEAHIENIYNLITQHWLPEDFEPSRARAFFNVRDSFDRLAFAELEPIKSCNSSFKIFRTQAFQLGVLMAFSYLKSALAIRDGDAFVAAAERWLAIWNGVITKEVSGERRALFAYDREMTKGILGTHVGRLQASDWYWFRYFTFEQLAASSEDFPGKEPLVRDALPFLRLKYVTKLSAAIKEAAENASGESISDAEALERAKKRWSDALRFSFGTKKESFTDSLRLAEERAASTHEPTDVPETDNESDETNGAASSEEDDSAE